MNEGPEGEDQVEEEIFVEAESYEAQPEPSWRPPGDPTHAMFVDGAITRFTDDPDSCEGVAVELPANFIEYGSGAWRIEGTAFVENIEADRARIWESVKAEREAIIVEPCATPFDHDADADEASRTIVAQLAAKAPELYPINFKFADNAVRACSQADMAAIDTALEQKRQQARDAADAIHADLNSGSLTSIAQLRAVPVGVRERMA
jgi:hypothetical protein